MTNFCPIAIIICLPKEFFIRKAAYLVYSSLENSKKLFLMILNYLLCSKLVLPSGIFNFYSPPRAQIIIELTFCTCNEIQCYTPIYAIFIKKSNLIITNFLFVLLSFDLIKTMIFVHSEYFRLPPALV